MVSGESHHILGRRYRLRVVYGDGPARVVCSKSILEIQVRQGATLEERARVLRRWYREQLKAIVPPLVEKWQEILGVHAAGGWGIKRMKTKWGACNTGARRIWLNLELAKKPPRCIEYVVVHELAHLLERHHNERFLEVMNRYLPQWRLVRQELNAEPLVHEAWSS